MLSTSKFFHLILILGYKTADPGYVIEKRMNITLVRDNGQCLKWSSPKLYTTSFSSCNDKPSQNQWELDRWESFKYTLCIPNQPICLGAQSGSSVKLQSFPGLGMEAFMWKLQGGRNHTSKFVKNNLCLDISRIGSNLVLSKCDDNSKSQEFHSLDYISWPFWSLSLCYVRNLLSPLTNFLTLTNSIVSFTVFVQKCVIKGIWNGNIWIQIILKVLRS